MSAAIEPTPSAMLQSARPNAKTMAPTNNVNGGPTVWNVPNAITSVRFFLAVAVMILIPLHHYLAAMITFSVAAATDWMDGYWARKYGQVTKLGRIFDPFVDKIIICGSFIALVEWGDSPVASWMATVVVARELLVTSLRGMIEGAGGDFSANGPGKWKMVLQCAAVIAILLSRVAADVVWINTSAHLLLWAALGLTVYSGYVYVVAAIRVMSAGGPNLGDADNLSSTTSRHAASPAEPLQGERPKTAGENLSA